MKKILGYTDKLTVRPGEDIEFKISTEAHASYTAQLVRLINGDIHSKVVNFKEIEIAASINGEYKGRKQSIVCGSCVIVDNTEALETLDAFTLALRFMPTMPNLGQQHLLSRWDESTHIGWSLQLTPQGQLAFVTSDDRGKSAMVVIDQVLKAKHWYQATVRVSWGSQTMVLQCTPLAPTATHLMDVTKGEVTGAVNNEFPTALPPLLMAAAFGGRNANKHIVPFSCFNGRLEAPVIYHGILSDSQLASVAAGERPRR